MKRMLPGRRGFTLVELLIGIAISIIVMAALIEVFSNQQKVYASQSQLTKEEQAARTAMAMLSRDIRMAGYTGVPLGNDQLVDNTATYHYFPLMSLIDGGTGDVRTNSGAPVVNYTGTIITALKALKVDQGASDALEIRGNFFRDSTTLSAPVLAGANSLPVFEGSTVFGGTGFNQAGWVIVGQTGATVRVQIYPITGPVVGGNLPIGGITSVDYAAGATVAPIFSRVYYATPGDATLGARRRKLWVANYVPTADNSNVVLAGTPQEFAVDIDKFQVHYELDEGFANQLTLSQSMVCDPCQVRNVRLSLWTSPDPNKYNNVPTDLATRLRTVSRQFSASVRVRNAGFEATSCPITPQPCGWDY